MTILISAVGNTDPISKNRDSALMHIARKYKPERIVLLYSEEMLVKKTLIERALLSFKDYKPDVKIHEQILRNDEVYLYDKMYEIIGKIIKEYSKLGEELILNLSSGTPQIKSALFAINRIDDYNTQAIQVTTPSNSSNNPQKILSKEEEDNLFKNNEDNQDNYENRCIMDIAEKFNHSLVKRHLRSLIESYDYLAVEKIVIRRDSKGLLSNKQLARLRIILTDLVNVFKKQEVLSEIQKYPLSEVEKKALNYFLMIEILNKRGQVADVLIKSKSLVEFILEDRIKRNHPNLIIYKNKLPKLNKEHQDFKKVIGYLDSDYKKSQNENEEKKEEFSPTTTLNLIIYTKILEYYKYSPELIRSLRVIISLNNERNKVAHGLSEIDSKLVNSKKLQQTIDTLRFILQDTFEIDDSYFSCYQTLNNEMLDLLRQ
jgi:hypothetical protein